MELQTHTSVVPWRNPEQFYKVFKCLYSKSLTDKRWAVDQIAVWESRCHPALPKAIEATVGLVRAIIQDLLFQVEYSFCQAKDVQMFYAMALIRFISLTLEVQHNNGIGKIQMHTLAGKVKIPQWMVELRHEAVHSFCPSLPMLRMGVKTAMKYLEETFWTVEAANIKPIVIKPACNKKGIVDLIAQYQNIQRCRQSKSQAASDLLSDLRVILRKLRGYMEDSKENVLDALLQPGIFLCPEDLIDILQASVPTYMDLEFIDLPPQLEKFWVPFIRILHEYDSIPLFLEKLLLSQRDCFVAICQKVAAAWAERLLIATCTQNTKKNQLDMCFKKKGALFNLPRLLYCGMMGTNIYLNNVFDMIASKTGNKKGCAQCFCIIAMRQGCFADNKETDTEIKEASKTPTKRHVDIVFTLDDVEDDLNELKMRRKRPRRDDNFWSLAPVSFDMSKIPLGAVLNPLNSEVSAQEESEAETIIENPQKKERFIFVNENDEGIVEEKNDTPDNFLETYIPTKDDMVYRRKQKN